MTIFNILFFGFMFRVIGGMFTNSKDKNAVPRLASLIAVGAIITLQVDDVVRLGALLWLFYVVRIFPTNTLFSAVHGGLPRPENAVYSQIIQDIAKGVDIKLNRRDYKMLGVIYGTLRASLALPAMLIVGGWLFLAQGVVYYLAGRINERHGVAIAEVVSGAIFGALI